MIIARRVVLLPLLIIYFFSYSQDTEEKPFHIPPSPEAASIAKFVESPVSKYTGLPEINIPIYEMKYGDISLPIGIRYHAGGFKPAEDAGWVGLGWSLNAGGLISRTVKGFDDLLNNQAGVGYPHAIASNDLSAIPSEKQLWEIQGNEISTLQLNDVCNGVIDPEPDIFYINLPGLSGKFHLMKKSGNLIKGVMVEPSKVSIEYNISNEEWTIISSSGVKYYLATKEVTINHFESGGGESVGGPTNTSKNEIIYAFDHSGPDLADPKVTTTTGWYLDKIVDSKGFEIDLTYSNQFEYETAIQFSENKVICPGYGVLLDGHQDCESFNYTQVNNQYFGTVYKENVIDEYYLNSCVFEYMDDKLINYLSPTGGIDPEDAVNQINVPCLETTRISGSKTIRKIPYVKEIVSGVSTLEFSTSDRSDLEAYDQSTGAQKLDTVKIISTHQNDRVVNQFVFKYSDFRSLAPDPEFSRLRLDTLIEINEHGEKLPYVFDYEPIPNNLSKSTFDVDHWGYWNGANNSDQLIPEINYSGQHGMQKRLGADRSVDVLKKKAGVLKSIAYPTGGETSFEFESNQYATSEINPVERTYASNETTGSIQQFQVNTPTNARVTINLNCGYFNYENPPIDVEELCSFDFSLDDTYEYFTLKNISNESNHLTVMKRFENDYQYYENNFISPSPSLINGGFATYNSYGMTISDTLSLIAGIYEMEVDPMAKDYLNVEATIQYNDIVQADMPLVLDGPGLRVKKITMYDGLSHENDIVKKYQYVNERTGLSSGQLMSEVTYSYEEVIVTQLQGLTEPLATVKLKAQSNPIMPLGMSAQGSALGYSSVKEIIGENGEFGSTTSYFRNEPDYHIIRIPNSPSVSEQAQNGLPDSIFQYDANNNPVYKVKNTYSNDLLTESPVSIFMYGKESCANSNLNIISYIGYSFTRKSDWWYKTKSEEYSYSTDSLGTIFKTDKEYYYDNFDHKQITRIITNESGKKTREIRIDYPLDNTGLAPGEMWNELNTNYQHIHDRPIQVTETVNGQIVKGKRQMFDYQNGMIVLEKHQTRDNQNNYILDYEVNSFNPRGLPREVTTRDGIQTVLIWGYDYTKLVAEIKNASWSQVMGVVNSTDLTNIENGSAPNSAVRSSIGSLRNGLASAFITSYLYDPLIGVVEITDPNNRPQTFQYTNNRLEMIRDHENYILQKFEYDYVNSLDQE